MRAVAKKPGAKPGIIEIDNSLEALQEFVGGYIETVTPVTDAVIICNEEGRLLDLTYNAHVLGMEFVGPVLVVGTQGDRFCSLNPAAAEFIMTCWFKEEA